MCFQDPRPSKVMAHILRWTLGQGPRHTGQAKTSSRGVRWPVRLTRAGGML